MYHCIWIYKGMKKTCRILQILSSPLGLQLSLVTGLSRGLQFKVSALYQASLRTARSFLSNKSTILISAAKIHLQDNSISADSNKARA